MSIDSELQVTDEIEGTRFNTGISAMMEFINAAYKVFSVKVLELVNFHFGSTVNFLTKAERFI